MRATKLLSILFIAGTLTLGLTMSQSAFGGHPNGPPGNPHDADGIPRGNPHIVPDPDDPTGETTIKTTGNPHSGPSPPPGYGDPHVGSAKGNPHGEDRPFGNPHATDPRPSHANLGEGVSNASHGEDTFTTFPGEATFFDFSGEAPHNDFPGEAFSNVDFSEPVV